MIDPESHEPRLECYPAPQGSCLCSTLGVRVNGEPQPVYHTGAGNFLYFSFFGEVTIEISNFDQICGAWVTPWRLGIKPDIHNKSLSFSLDKPGQLIVQINDGPPLFIFANPLEYEKPPNPRDPKVHFFEAGKIHEIDILEIGSDETVYIEGGAIVKGGIHAIDGSNVVIRGRGILDGSSYACMNGPAKSILMERCCDATVEGIIMIHPNTWMLTVGDCERVLIRNLKQIGEVMSSNGIVICGSRDIEVRDSFLRNNDDCVTVLATGCLTPEKRNRYSWCKDVSNIRILSCVLLNSIIGNTMEIGSETRTSSIRDIRFEDIDVVGAHGEGSVFAIQAGDRATVSDITWENIRVEHFYDKLIDFRILETRWSKDCERGHIKDVTLKNIEVCKDHFNTPSLIGGYDSDHQIEGVHFIHFRLGGSTVTDEDSLGLFTKHAKGIHFTA